MLGNILKIFIVADIFYPNVKIYHDWYADTHIKFYKQILFVRQYNFHLYTTMRISYTL